MFADIETLNFPYWKISIVIGQIKNLKNSTNYLRKKDWWNLKTVNYLDIILVLKTGTYKPYRKPNDEMLYIHAKSNHPANILKQLPMSIETRLPNLSSNSEIFHEASKHYQNILNQSGYSNKLQYKPPNSENENTSKSSKNRKRNIIMLNPPFSKKSPTTSVNISFV